MWYLLGTEIDLTFAIALLLSKYYSINLSLNKQHSEKPTGAFRWGIIRASC